MPNYHKNPYLGKKWSSIDIFGSAFFDIYKTTFFQIDFLYFIHADFKENIQWLFVKVRQLSHEDSWAYKILFDMEIQLA